VQNGIAGPEQAREFAERIIKTFGAPVRFQDRDIQVTASVGVALAPADGSHPERLLKSADLALYASKAAGRDCIRLFAPEMDAELQARLKLEKTIRDAVRRKSFVLHYQPVLEMDRRHLRS